MYYVSLRCKTPHLTDDEVKTFFVGAMNAALTNKKEILDSCRTVVEFLTDTSQLESDLRKLEADRDVATELLRKCIDENAKKGDENGISSRYDKLILKYESVKNKIGEITDEMQSRSIKRMKITEFLAELEAQEGTLCDFDELFWRRVVEKIIVYRESKVIVEFKDGRQIEVSVLGK